MFVYTVQNGDTLWQIAKEQQISLDALLAANPQVSDPNYILPGSRVNVPRLIRMGNGPATEMPAQNELDWQMSNGAGMDMDTDMEAYTNMQAEAQTEPPPATAEPYCTAGSARPCILVTKGGESLTGISEEWEIPLAQLHYHNYQYSPTSQLPGGERIIIPLVPDYRINMGRHNPQAAPRGRRRR